MAFTYQRIGFNFDQIPWDLFQYRKRLLNEKGDGFYWILGPDKKVTKRWATISFLNYSILTSKSNKALLPKTKRAFQDEFMVLYTPAQVNRNVVQIKVVCLEYYVTRESRYPNLPPRTEMCWFHSFTLYSPYVGKAPFFWKTDKSTKMSKSTKMCQKSFSCQGKRAFSKNNEELTKLSTQIWWCKSYPHEIRLGMILQK